MSNTVRIEFTNELGAQYVEMRVFKVVPWGLSRSLQSVGDVEKDASAQMAMAEKVAIALVVAGDVKNAWTGEAMSVPFTDESIAEAPAEMLVAVLAKFGEMRREASDDVKK